MPGQLLALQNQTHSSYRAQDSASQDVLSRPWQGLPGVTYCWCDWRWRVKPWGGTGCQSAGTWESECGSQKLTLHCAAPPHLPLVSSKEETALCGLLLWLIGSCRTPSSLPVLALAYVLIPLPLVTDPLPHCHSASLGRGSVLGAL